MTPSQLAIARSIVAFTNPALTSLALVSHRVDLSTAKHPRYPADAVAECPQLLLRHYKGNLKARPNKGVDWDYAFSYWYYKLQLAGQTNQESQMADEVTIESLFAGSYGPELILAAGADFVMILETVTHDELEHRHGSPRLRVSVTEILIGVKAHIN